VTDEELLSHVAWLRETMIAAATHTARIQDINDEFRNRYAAVAAALGRRQIVNPLPYGDLWDWWGKCKAGDLPSYQSRREYLNDLFSPLETRLRTGQPIAFEATGWPRVDRAVDEIRERLSIARNEEQFQAVGLLCREALISLAQAVYDPARHPSLDGVAISDADAGRMLTSYIAVEMGGDANEDTRRHAKSALGLALALQHKRTADFRMAAACTEATSSTINIIAIMSGRRDPEAGNEAD
jgi:hypothetical protein